MTPDPPRDRFDPDAWAALLESDHASPAGFLFRRGIELASEAIVKLGTSHRVWLDLGCGTGHLSAALAALGRCVVAVDHDLSMLRWSRRDVPTDPGGAAHHRVAAQGARLSLRDASVDGAVAVSLLGCLADPAAVLREAARVVRSGGVLVATVTSRTSLLRRCEHLLRLPRPPADACSGGIRAYGISEIGRLVDQAAFGVVAMRGYGLHLQIGRQLVPSASRSRALEARLPRSLEHALARNLLLIARRR